MHRTSPETNSPMATKTPDRRRTGERAPNPWPAPPKSEQMKGGATGLGSRGSGGFGGGGGALGFGYEKSPRPPRSSSRRPPRDRQPSGSLKLRDPRQRKAPRRPSRRDRSERSPTQTKWDCGRSERSSRGFGGDEQKPFGKKDESPTTRSRDLYYSSYSYGATEQLSEHLNSALQLDDTPSPRGLSRTPACFAGSTSAVAEKHIEKQQQQIARIEPKNAILRGPSPMRSSSSILIIETRRTEIRDGGVCYEESHSISFPNNLPPNVHIVTGNFSASRTITA